MVNATTILQGRSEAEAEDHGVGLLASAAAAGPPPPPPATPPRPAPVGCEAASARSSKKVLLLGPLPRA